MSARPDAQGLTGLWRVRSILETSRAGTIQRVAGDEAHHRKSSRDCPSIEGLARRQTLHCGRLKVRAKERLPLLGRQPTLGRYGKPGIGKREYVTRTLSCRATVPERVELLKCVRFAHVKGRAGGRPGEWRQKCQAV